MGEMGSRIRIASHRIPKSLLVVLTTTRGTYVPDSLPRTNGPSFYVSPDYGDDPVQWYTIQYWEKGEFGLFLISPTFPLVLEHVSLDLAEKIVNTHWAR